MSDRINEISTLALAGYWRATPDDYSSIRNLCFEADWACQLIYAYGQTIYLILPFKWNVPTNGRLRLTYSAPTGGRLAADFVLDDSNRVKEISFTLTAGKVTGVENVVPNPYEYDQTLELSDSPWPDDLKLPFGAPRTFFGFVNKKNAPGTESGSETDGSHQASP